VLLLAQRNSTFVEENRDGRVPVHQTAQGAEMVRDPSAHAELPSPLSFSKEQNAKKKGQGF
jgi:hypothetical protein